MEDRGRQCIGQQLRAACCDRFKGLEMCTSLTVEWLFFRGALREQKSCFFVEMLN